MKYDPDGQCRCDALDKVLLFFGREMPCEACVDGLLPFSLTTNILESVGLKSTFFISPLIAAGYWLNGSKLNMSKINYRASKFRRFAAPKVKYAIMHDVMARDLYGIDVYWNHCVVEMFCPSGYLYYDGLHSSIISERLDSAIKAIPSPSQLDGYAGFKTLIWEQ